MGYHQFFTDAITLYHKHMDVQTREDVFACIPVSGVMVRQKVTKDVKDGIVHMVRTTSVTFLPETDPGENLAVGDLLVLGDGLPICDSYSIKQLKRDHPELCEVRAIVDNRNKPYLKHRRVDCV